MEELILHDEKFKCQINGKVWTLPIIMKFEISGIQLQKYKTNEFFYEIVDYRCPKKGEWYLSGAIAGAWLAPNDLNNEFLVVAPTAPAKQIKVYTPDEELSDEDIKELKKMKSK